MCGKCCKAITLGEHGSPEYIENQARLGNKDAQFIKENWVPISAKEVFKIRPEAEFKAIFKRIGQTYWWKCKNVDPQTNKCKMHDKRPDVCKGFPYYGDGKLGKNFIPYSMQCGYLEDLEYLEEWKTKIEED